MMLRRTLELATPGTRLSVAHSQLVIDRPDQPRATVPLADLGIVIVDDRQASYTHAVLVGLLGAGASLLVTGADHLPAGLLLPLDAHHVQTERHRAQVACSLPVQKRAWHALVRCKIEMQARVLVSVTGSAHGLDAMARRVRSGDSGNLEAQAAQRYWPLLFGKSFRRDRDQPGANALLNYGYAVLRATTARAIVAAVLIPSLGLFHRNRGNPFCLADDLMEPFRPLVDFEVQGIVANGTVSLDVRENRARLLSIFARTVSMPPRRLPLLLAIEAAAQGLSRLLVDGTGPLVLPQSLFLIPDAEDGAGEVPE